MVLGAARDAQYRALLESFLKSSLLDPRSVLVLPLLLRRGRGRQEADLVSSEEKLS